MNRKTFDTCITTFRKIVSCVMLMFTDKYLILFICLTSITGQDVPSPNLKKSQNSCKSVPKSICSRCPNLRGKQFNSPCPGSNGYRIEVNCLDTEVPIGTVQNYDKTKWFTSCNPELIDQKRQDIQGVFWFEFTVVLFCLASSIYLCIQRRERNRQVYMALKV